LLVRRSGPDTAEKAWWWAILPILRPFRWQLGAAMLALACDSILNTLRPWPLKVVTDVVLTGKKTKVPFIAGWLNDPDVQPMTIIWGSSLAILLIAMGTGAATYYYRRAIGDVGQRFVYSLRQHLFAHMQRLSLRFHDRQRTGDLMTRITSDTRSIQDFVEGDTDTFLDNTIRLTVMIGLMLWLDWRFAMCALSIAPFLFLTVYRYTRRIKAASKRGRVSEGLLASIAQETLSSIRIVQGLAQEEQQAERFRVQSANSVEAYREGIRYQAMAAPLVDILSAAGLSIVMWYGATGVLRGDLTTGDVIIFFSYITGLYSPMKSLSRLAYSYSKTAVRGERIAEILRTDVEVKDLPDARKAPPFKGSVEFRGVDFAYEPGKPVLNDINLKIQPGECVAIVGATGAGKSTLVSLLPRLYDPTAGSVLIDGADLRSYKVQSLREQISLVLQDSLLFRGTIRDNIAFGCPDASDEAIEAAARTANADEFIARLERGYDTEVAERGSSLSGGQKQRIAIARAVLRDAPILILDEPTSGLDANAERLVIEALERAAKGRTTLIIAHRLTTIRFASRVVVMDAGRIVESGTPDELLALNGRYAQLHRLQFKAGVPGGATVHRVGAS
jgi:subfamily B ATP-binding cassette protein MsbA